MRTIAVKKDSSDFGSIWSLVKERDCDPRPGKYSLRHPNGSFHPDLRGYDNGIDLKIDATNKYNFVVKRIFQS